MDPYESKIEAILLWAADGREGFSTGYVERMQQKVESGDEVADEDRARIDAIINHYGIVVEDYVD